MRYHDVPSAGSSSSISSRFHIFPERDVDVGDRTAAGYAGKEFIARGIEVDGVDRKALADASSKQGIDSIIVGLIEFFIALINHRSERRVERRATTFRSNGCVVIT